MKRILIICGLLVLIAAGVGFWLYNDPAAREIRRIQERLTAFAREASFTASDSPLSRVAYATTVSRYFTDPVELDVTVNEETVGHLTRARLEELANIIRNTVRSLRMEFLDIVVELDDPSRLATAHLTAKIEFPGNGQDYWIQELKLTLVREDGTWRIRDMTTVSTFEP